MYKSDHMLETPIEPELLTMEQRSGLGNQQENEDALGDINHEIEVASARIAMFLDTDGFLTIQVRQHITISGQHHRDACLTPECGFVNTSAELMNWLHETMDWLGIPHYMKWFSVDQLKGSRARKPQCRIVVRGMMRCQRLIGFVQHYLVGKAKQGRLISELIESRIGKQKITYSDRELEIANEIRALNSNKSGEWRPISSETLRQTVELRKHMRNPLKIKSDLRRNAQSTSEMNVPA